MTYGEMKKRHTDEINSLPIRAAFNNSQFEEMMTNWGLKVTDTDKICSLGAGCYMRKSDVSDMREMFSRHHQELTDAIAADETGDGFVAEMFRYELDNHEYGYTGDEKDAIRALGYTVKQVYADRKLCRGLKKATKEIMQREGACW